MIKTKRLLVLFLLAFFSITFFEGSKVQADILDNLGIQPAEKLLADGEDVPLTLETGSAQTAQSAQTEAEIQEKKAQLASEREELEDFFAKNVRKPNFRLRAGTTTANTWAGVVSAYANGYDQVNLTASVTANSDLTISRNFTISGNGTNRTMTMGNYTISLSRITGLAQLYVEDVTVTSTSNNSLITTTDSSISDSSSNATGTKRDYAGKNWLIVLNNVSLGSGNTNYRLVDAWNAFTLMSGRSTITYTRSAGTIIDCANLQISDATINATISGYFWSHYGGNFKVLINQRSQVSITHISGDNAFSVGDSGNSSSNLEVKGSIQVAGDPSLKTRTGNTSLSIVSSSTASGDSGGVINFGLKADSVSTTTKSGTPSFVSTDYATVDIYSQSNNSTPCVMIQSFDATFLVDNHSYMRLRGKNQTSSYASVIRFRYSGYATFAVDNSSEMYVIKESGLTPAIRMSGLGNSFSVKGGSRLYVKNYGTSGSYNNGDASNSTSYSGQTGAAVCFFGLSDRVQSTTFTVDGQDSMMSFNSESGPGIDAGSIDIDIVQGKGSIFEVTGHTSESTSTGTGTSGPANSGIFRTGTGALNFTMTEPQYYDFTNKSKNTRAGQMSLLSSSAVGSSFNSVLAPVAVWKLGTAGEGLPYYERLDAVNYVLNTNAFSLILSPDAAFRSGFGNSAQPNTRISANNNPPNLDYIVQPTDADTYIYAKLSVNEGFDDSGNRIVRPARAGEAKLRIEVTKPDGTSQILTGTSAASVSSYKGAISGGVVFNITNSNGSAAFLEKGSTIRVIDCWRGGDNPTNYPSIPASEIAKIPVLTVYDGRAPAAASISTTLTNASKFISGTGEVGAHVYVKLNGANDYLKNGLGDYVTTQVDNTGHFTLYLPNYLPKGQTLDVYLNDDSLSVTQLQELVKTSTIPTNTWDAIDGKEGNTNAKPTASVTYHNYTTQPATRLTVADVLPDDLSATKTLKVYRGGVLETNTKVGDTIEYTVTATNNKVAKWQNIFMEDTLSDALDFNAATCDAKVDGVPLAPANIIYDATSRKLTLNAEKTLNGAGTITFTFKVVVNLSALNKEFTNKATVTGYSEEETPFTVGDPDPLATLKSYAKDTNQVKNPGGAVQKGGSLRMEEVPNIDFGKQKIHANTQEIRKNPTYQNDLDILDDRSSKSDWQVYVSLSKGFKNANGKQTRDILYYRSYETGISSCLYAGGAAIEVVEKTAGTANVLDEYNPTTYWRNSATNSGFYLNLNPGDVEETGLYTGELTWILTAAPTQ